MPPQREKRRIASCFIDQGQCRIERTRVVFEGMSIVTDNQNNAVSREPSTEDKVAFLSKPNAYSHRPSEVQVLETHMSWIFLAGERVYKLKKPVVYPFLDFSTPERREANCRQEVTLNRRLANNVYLGVIALRLGSGNSMSLGGLGKAIDWVVEMKRLPADRMLDRLITTQEVNEASIAAVTDVLLAFYRDCDRPRVNGLQYVKHFADEHNLNRMIITDPRFDLSEPRFNELLSQLDEVIYRSPDELLRRVSLAKIVNGHGDLRPEHVCVEEPPVVIDCLEFNETLRLVDPIDEITFLGLECAQLGASWITDFILRRYLEKSGDEVSSVLRCFYWRYRACLRARLSLMHVLEGDKRKPEKWLPLARRYLELAVRASS